MRPGVNIAEADDCPARLRPGEAQPRRPERLQNQSVRAGRDRLHQFVEERFRLDALRIGQLLLAQAELLLEPGNHPVATVDLDLKAVLPGGSGRVGWDERNNLDVFFVCGIDRGGRAIT